MSHRTCVRLAAVLIIVLVAGCDDDPVSPVRYEYSEAEVLSFDVGDGVKIVADTFVGSVTFTEGEAGRVKVTVTKRADREEDLDGLQVASSQLPDEIQLSATNPDELDDVAVDIEITGPPQPVLDLAAGVGSVGCTGRPGSRWSADVGVGHAKLIVPGDVNLAIELTAGVGSVSVGFDVTGQVQPQLVSGVIGTGDEGEIVAHVGVGSVSLDRQ